MRSSPTARAERALALLLLTLSVPLAAQTATVVVEKAGRPEEMKGLSIQTDSFRKVEARQGPARFSWRAAEVLEIRHDKAPEAWNRGYSAFKDNEFNTAVGHLRTALESADRHKWIEVYANFYLGQSLRSLGQLDEAEEAFRAVIKADAEHRLVPQSYDALGQMAMMRGQPGAATARAAFTSLKGLAEKEKLDPLFVVGAKRGLATLEARFGDSAKGRAELQSLLGEASALVSESNLIRLEIGRVLNREKKFEEAEAYFSAILEKANVGQPDPLVIAGASNGLGDAQYYRNEYEKALETYSRVYGLFNDRDDLEEYVAHALFYGGQAFDLQSGRESDPEKKKVYSRRGSNLIRRAAGDQFKGTSGGSEARKHLGF